MAAIPIYSSVLIANAGFTGEASFEIPVDTVLIVRDIDCVAGISAGGLVWAYDTEGVQLWANLFGVIGAGKQWAGWRGRQVIPSPGFFYISTDFECDIRASGYILSAP